MNNVLPALVVLTPLVLLGYASWHRARHWTTWRDTGRAFARRNLCSVEERFVSVLDHQFRRQELAQVLAFVVAAAFFYVLGMLDAGRTVVEQIPLVAVLLIGLARALLSCWHAAHPPRPGETTPRLARLRQLRVRDVVSPALRGGSWLGALLTSGIVVAAATRSNQVTWVWALVAAAAGILLAQLVVEATASWVVGRPAPANDAAHLYWQDACRAESLTDAYGASLLTGPFIVMFVSLEAFDVPFWVGVVPMVPAALIFAAAETRGRLRFRRRLWGWLGPDEVVLPGSTLVPR